MVKFTVSIVIGTVIVLAIYMVKFSDTDQARVPVADIKYTTESQEKKASPSMARLTASPARMQDDMMVSDNRPDDTMSDQAQTRQSGPLFDQKAEVEDMVTPAQEQKYQQIQDSLREATTDPSLSVANLIEEDDTLTPEQRKNLNKQVLEMIAQGALSVEQFESQVSSTY